MDEVAVRWESLLEGLRSSLDGEANVVETHRSTAADAPVFAGAEFQPAKGSEPQLFLLCIDGNELLLSFGDGANRWELDWNDDSLVMIERIAQAVCAGRWKQYSAPGRKHLDVELDDGTVVDSSGWEAPIGLIPMPGWLRRARKRGQGMKDAERYHQFVADTFRAAAVAELGDLPYEVTIVHPEVLLETTSAVGDHFRMLSRGDVFELFYRQDFVYMDFIMDVDEELAGFATEALREVRRLCDGRAIMMPTKTRIRRRPMYELTTASGEIWPFMFHGFS
ncbi:hypothetical protein [Arthrobacter sp. KK5.5]|uniref:hypothetical protein n=1 Tax=Arthrobacter sp. KK5.5 TaxID=3373084 RepID=UPI003EE60368